MAQGQAVDDSMRVAVVGMAGRFSGAADLDEYWDNLVQGVESVRTLSRTELLEGGEDPRLLDDRDYVPRYGTMERVEWFDAGFFDYSPQDALLMDPQQRVFLECAWQALENAGCDPRQHPGAIAVYAGAKDPDYRHVVEAHRQRFPGIDDYRIAVGNDVDTLATRVSYKLGLTGPSMTVLSTCSTSLVAIHVACQSLLGGECDMALAGGVRLRIPRVGYVFREGGVRSADGHCRAFDAAADGTVGGEGVAVVVLKLLPSALEDGDHIHAVILGSAVNNDGAERIGYAAPSADGQARVIRMAHVAAQVEADSIGYVETHGTATHIGDPIEVAGLTRAFRASTDRRGFCPIGSVKANIGHTDAAAGAAGFIKVVLSLRHGLVPPSINCTSPNPQIDFESSPFFVNTGLRPWERGATPRRGGVSSFGMGGTNAHVVLEEAPDRPEPGIAPAHHLLVLSAKTPGALDVATRNLARHLDVHPEQSLADVAHTLQVGRRAMPRRRFAVCRDGEDAREVLGGGVPERLHTAGGEPLERPVVFLFPGQGAQHAGMARGLYESVGTFRLQVDECCAILAAAGIDLRPLFRADAAGAPTPEQLERTETAQPALFVVEYALARLWMRWGVRPAAMLGHSVGELVAATLAGVLSLPDALALVAARGRLMQAMPPGSMLAVPLPEAGARELLGDDLAIAAVNGPLACVLSGPDPAIDALARALAGRGVRAQRLHTSHAFHSPMMDGALAEFEDRARSVARGAPAIPYVSNVTGTWIEEAEATDPAYWARHMRATVRFSDGLATVLGDGGGEADLVLLETGPGRGLAQLARQQPRAARCPVVSSLPHPASGTPDLAGLLTAAGHLWLAGTSIDWMGVHEERRRRVPLPTYPFERQRYLLDLSWRARQALAPGEPVPFAAAAPESALPNGPREPGAPDRATEVERGVAVLFGEVLGVEGATAASDFFELGGDSLVASQLIARMRETFAVPIPLKAIFETPNVAGLARRIDALIAEADEEAGDRLGTLL
ncbi:MAG TPA: beta-ketoacyl synthase N-terminal-like domain-containing protein [Candidatus Dormibacteraeota bacterium]|jgi:acyl transferase domain-containing protein